MELFIKLKNLDRRWVFLCVAFSVMLPMIFKWTFRFSPARTLKVSTNS
ncbi:hypothetical protein MASR1M12_43340 [Erysipelotrichia bacterium]